MKRHPLLWPSAIAAVSLAGLVAGLMGEGWWDVAAALGLAVPMVAIAWGMRRV